MKNIKIIDIDGGGGIPGGGMPPTHTTESAITSKSPISSTQGTSYASWAGIAAAKVGGGTSYLVRIVIPDMPDDGSVWIALSTTKDITGALASWNKAGTYQVIVTSDESPDTQLYLVSVNMAGLDTTPTAPQVSSIQVNEYDDTYTPDPRSTTPALLQPIKFRDYVQAILGKHDTGIGWDNDSAEAIDTDSGYDGVGVFFDQGETIGDVLDMALQGYTACKWCDADGKMKFTRLVDPSTQPIENSAITVRTAGEMFFTGDGTTTQAQLSIGARNVSSPTITAIHQTDWQGRVELSDQPRTNLVNSLTAATMNSTVTAAASSFIMPSATPATRYTFSSGSTGYIQLSRQTTQSNVPTIFVAEIHYVAGTGYFGFQVARAGDPAPRSIESVNVLTGATSPYAAFANLGNDTFLVVVTLPATMPAYDIVGALFITPAGNPVPASNDGASFDIGAIGLYANATTRGAYTPPAVTVTDYTVSDTGLITLGQPLSDGGTLDWDGSGTITIAGVVDENAMLTDLIPTQDTAPALSTRMGARRNWKQFADGDLVAPSTNFPPAVRQYLLAKFQQVMASAKAIDNTYIHAKYADPAPSAFDNADDAQTEIDRICDIYTKQRWFYTTEVALDAVPGLDLGQVWRLVYPLYGLESGKNVMVTSFQPDLINNTAQITLWG